MLCEVCGACGVAGSPRCADHYDDWFVARVRQTIDEHNLCGDGPVGVAVSGGKDSLALLDALRRLNYEVRVLFVDEGIGGYREHTKRLLEAYCAEHHLPLHTKSFAAEASALDEMQPEHPCSVCGVLRRKLLERAAKEARCAVVATGHNADDEAQTALMNLTRAQLGLLARMGPRTRSASGDFIPRVKPLYFLTEKQTMTYALLRGLTTHFSECPYASRSLRWRIRRVLNRHMDGKRKVALLRRLAALAIPVEATATKPCRACGAPSGDGLCAACRFTVAIEPANDQTT